MTYLQGTTGDDSLVGSAFNDELDGGLGNDTLYGAGGNDTLRGGPGNDTYYFGRGDGQDVIEDAPLPGEQDRLQLGAGISLADVTFSVGESGDLIVTIKNSGDTVRLRGYTYNAPAERPLIVFADGTTLDGLAVEQALFNGGGFRYGTDGDDAMVGSAFHDELDGGLGNDSLYGAGGNDTLRGGPGSDTYYFGRGDGQDVIEDVSAPGEQDRVQLGAGISLADVTFSVDNGDLVITVKNSSDTVRLRGYTYGDPTTRPLIVFADGATLDGFAVDQALFSGGGFRHGTDGADAMVGGAFTDELDGGLGNDALYGGGGNDTLRGGPGSDTYYFGRGDGQDVIEDAPMPGEQDRLQLGAGISLADVNLSLDNGDLVITVKNSSDTVRLRGYTYGDPTTRPLIVFADGATLDGFAVDQALFSGGGFRHGTDGADAMVGGAFTDELDGGLGNDALYGGGGNDTLRGGPGSDTYYFGRGDGQDVIEDAPAAPGEQDRLQLGAGISLADVSLSLDNGDLVITVKNSSDTVRLRGYTNFAPTERPLIVFADGATLDGFAVDQALFSGGGFRYGTDGADAMVGGAFTDELDGGLGNDALYGGGGNDTLRGGPGSDTYYFGRGDGQDVIEDVSAPGEQDRVQLGAGISLADVRLSVDNGDLVITLKNSSDTVRLRGYTYGDPTTRPLIVFADGATLDGFAVDQALFSGGGSRYGTMGADAMIGSAFSDELDGGLGNDSLYGAGGNDTLRGGPGSDTYYFGRGDGQDVIEDAPMPGEQDRLQLGAGISLADVTFSLDNGDLVITVKNSSDTVRLRGYTNFAPTERPLIVFADGATLDGFAVDRALFSGGGFRYGTQGADAMIGSAFHDELDGGLGNDSLYGAGGNDTLRGGPGRDTYYFGRGDGQDVIDDAPSAPGEQDRLQLGAGISLTDVSLSVDNGDLIITVKNSSDTVRLRGYTNFAPTERPLIAFADGATLDGFAVDQALFSGGGFRYGTQGADAMIGSAFSDELDGGLGNDALYGGGGNDTLRGGPGSDTYYFGRGDGQDVIDDAPAAPGEQDRLQLGAGISVADVSLSVDNGDLIVTVKNSSDTVRLRGYTYGDPMTRPLIVFADGATLDGLAVDRALFGGSDPRYGTNGADAMVGSAFHDEFDGGLGNDTLYGAGGNDTLRGGPGSDTYYFGRGDGQDVIEDAPMPGEQDRLQLGAGISLADVSLSLDNGDLVITVKNSSDTVRLRGYTNFAPTERPLIAFADGATLDGFAVDQALFSGGGFRYGTQGADAMIGSAFSDELDGGLGNDSLYGAGGNDTLRGGPGSDTYYFGRGDGQDVIEDGSAPGEQDRVQLGAGISLADVTFTVDNGDLVITVKNSSDTVRLRGYAFVDPMTRPLIVFADGATLDGFAVDQALFSGGGFRYGTQGADAMIGSAFSDELDGGLGNDSLYGAGGNDTLRGGLGSDTYYFGRGDGQDVIEDVPTAPGEHDRVQLAAGIAKSDIFVRRMDGKLILDLGGDTLTIADYFMLLESDRPQIVFSDGSVWSTEEIEALSQNHAPVVSTPLGDQVAKENQALIFRLPPQSFMDSDQGDVLSYSATLADGSALPSWLSFNASTGEFSGRPPMGSAGSLNVLVTATDRSGASASDDFKLVIGALPEILGTNSANSLTGTANAEKLSGLGGNDTLTGGGGADILDGGAGSDRMRGGTDDDLYIVNSTGDQVIEYAGEGIDSVQSSISLTLSGNVENLWLLGTSNLSGTGNSLANSLLGNSGINSLSGAAGHDTLDGGAGNDTLTGGTGNDTYMLGRGQGRDLIKENDATSGNTDVVQAAADIAADQLWFSRSGNDLEVTVIGTNDKMVVSNWYAGSQYQVEQFKSGDGQILLASQVNALVNAMASFAPPAPGQTTLPAAYQDTLNPVIAASWN